MNDSIELQISTQLGQDPASAALLERWFVGIMRHLWVEARGEPAEDWAHGWDSDLADVFPDKLATTVELYYSRVADNRPSRTLVWNEASLRRFLAAVLKSNTNGYLFVDQAGGHGPPDPVNIRVWRAEDSPGWVYFNAIVNEKILRDERLAQRALRFLKGFADVSNPSFGHVAPLFSTQTGLESLLRMSADERLAGSREVLRGYSWVTICPQEIGERLGGEAVLRQSGAFVEVAQLRAGGYWLLATPTYGEYDMAAAERVFRVVAPALPEGLPMDPTGWRDRDRYLVVIEDAANARNRGSRHDGRDVG